MVTPRARMLPVRRGLLISLLLGLTFALVPVAFARAPLTMRAITRALGLRDSYLDPKVTARVDIVQLERAARLRPGFRFVILAGLPRGVSSPNLVAQGVLADLRKPL